MNKPLTIAIKETKSKIINACNESGVPLAVLDLIVGGIYSEIHTLAEKQTLEDEAYYMNAIANKEAKCASIGFEGDTYVQKEEK